MSRLYDRVLSGCKTLAYTDSEIPRDYLERATVVDASNVARYFLEQPASERSKLLEHMPSVVPPIETMFVESTIPEGVQAEKLVGEPLAGEVWEHVKQLYSWGMLCDTYTWDQDEQANHDYLESIGQPQLWKYRYEIRWIVRVWSFAEAARKTPEGPLTWSIYVLGRDGSALKDEDGETLTVRDYPDTKDLPEAPDVDLDLENLKRTKKNYKKAKRKVEVKYRTRRQELERHKAAVEHNYGLLSVSIHGYDSLLLAMAFMHCKNVVISAVDPPMKPSEKHMQKHGQPLTRYHVLQIEPMKRVLKVEGRSDEVGLKKALHITRGHFRTYSREKPLFGKFAGTVWVSQHLRGAKESGEVSKDYSVKTPRRMQDEQTTKP